MTTSPSLVTQLVRAAAAPPSIAGAGSVSIFDRPAIAPAPPPATSSLEAFVAPVTEATRVDIRA